MPTSRIPELLPRHSPAKHEQALAILDKLAPNGITESFDLDQRSTVAELIAHEIEHVLEQLDGVDVRTEAGNGSVWKIAAQTCAESRWRPFP